MDGKSENPLTTKAQGRWTVSPEAHDIVRRMRANGCANETIAAALGMPTSTFRDHVEKDGPLAEAYGEGHAAMRDELIGICMKAAREGYIPAAFFALKTMHGMRENAPVSPSDSFDRAVEAATSEADLTMIRDRLTQFLKEIS